MKEVINDSFSARLANHPTLKARFESILDVAENTNGDLISADEAEQRAIEEVRQLGNELMHDWAVQRVEASANEFKVQSEKVVGNGQKKIVWHTTFGKIEVRERLFVQPGKQFR